MAGRRRLRAADVDGLQLPAKPVARIPARWQPLRRLQQSHRGGLQHPAAVDGHREADQVGRRRDEHARAAVARLVDAAQQLQAVAWVGREPRRMTSPDSGIAVVVESAVVPSMPSGSKMRARITRRNGSPAAASMAALTMIQP